MTPGAAVDALVGRLWPQGDPVDAPQVFAVVDGARDPRIAALLADTGLEQASLFAGPLSPALQAAAPRLVRLSPRARLTRRLLEAGWDDHWFVLLHVAPDVTLEALRRHLRELLRVRDEAGRVLMFRFYDPRVLRAYLPTCTGSEAAAVFGPVDAFACAAADPRGAVAFRRTSSGVAADTGAIAETVVGLSARASTLGERRCW